MSVPAEHEDIKPKTPTIRRTAFAILLVYGSLVALADGAGVAATRTAPDEFEAAHAMAAG